MPHFLWVATRTVHATLPSPDLALREPNGLLAAGGDLSVPTLLDAYRHGIFPWFSEGEPILWWSPDPRAVIFPDHVHVARRLARALRQQAWMITVDHCFERVIDACAAPRPYAPGTWLTPAMRRAYHALHEAGHAHSVECWRDGALVGGIYGVAIGRIFFGESMFSHATNASKVALIALCRRLHAWRYHLLDCQVESAHLKSLGAQSMPRRDFCDLLARACAAVAGDEAWSRGPATRLLA